MASDNHFGQSSLGDIEEEKKACPHLLPYSHRARGSPFRWLRCTWSCANPGESAFASHPLFLDERWVLCEVVGWIVSPSKVSLCADVALQ